MTSQTTVRYLRGDDDLTRITELIRSAYAVHAAAGLSFWATRQSVEDTARRFTSGIGFVAELDGQVVGTVTVMGPQPISPVLAYRDPSTWTFVQFAVAPAFQGRGVGRALHERVLQHVRACHGTTVTIDTAAPATDLIAMYERWGYRRSGECDWRPHTNYSSLVLTRPVRLADSPA